MIKVCGGYLGFWNQKRVVITLPPGGQVTGRGGCLTGSGVLYLLVDCGA